MAIIDKLTQIANAIRNKTGKSDKMTLEDMAKEISNIGDLINHADIPEYVKKEVLELANKIESVKQDDSIMFVAMSDTHYYNGQKDTDTYVDNGGVLTDVGNLHAAMAAKILAYLYNFDFMTHLGDHIWGTSNTSPEMAVSLASEILSLISEAHKDLPCFHAIGNHDTNMYYDEALNEAGNTGNYTLSGELLFNLFTKLSESDNTVFGDSTYGGYCYRDFPDKKLRVFLLNTVEYVPYGKSIGATYEENYCLGSQRKWFADNLISLNNKSDAADWRFIILSHYPADYANTISLSLIIKAYIEGGSIAVVTENGINYTYNFTNNKAQMIALFHGHVHNFLTSKLYSDSTNLCPGYRVAIPNCSYNRENYYGVVHDINYKEDVTYTKTADTAEDTSFVVNIINPSEELIYSLCYGAGKDRIISYKNIIYYEVEKVLEQVTTSNSIYSVEEGKPYEVTLVPTNLHNLTSVTVTMGGQDVSNYYNSNTKTITIPSVTGKIVIKAVAIRPVASINQIENNYKQGYYINSAGEETSRANSYATGYLPYQLGQKIRLYNVGFIKGSANADFNRITCFDSNKNYIALILANSTYPLQTVGGGTLNELNEWTSFTLFSNSQADMTSDVAFIRVSCEYLTPNSIITFDEPIKYWDEVSGGMSITNNLTNVTTSNTTSSVEYGNSYTSTIILNEKAEITDISITMDGEDVTSKFYNSATKVINIPRVTGNIIITVNAIIVNYTNLVPTATVPITANNSPRGTEIYNDPYGYMNNKRISGSDIVDGTGYVATGIIQWRESIGAFNTFKPIYIRGATLDPSLSYVRMQIFQDTANNGSSLYATVQIRGTSGTTSWPTYFTIETLGDNYYKLTPNESAYTNWYNIKYFMISLYGTGENLIITVDEPIG